MTPIKLKFGTPLGNLQISEELQATARSSANAFWCSQVQDDFMDGVDTSRPKGSTPDALDWLPHEELAELGFKAVKEDHQWVMTTGVGAHVDEINGPTLVWVLVNDAMYFKQGREKIVHRPGEWFIFSDALPHEVDSTKQSPEEAVWLGWTVKLAALRDG